MYLPTPACPNRKMFSSKICRICFTASDLWMFKRFRADLNLCIKILDYQIVIILLKLGGRIRGRNQQQGTDLFFYQPLPILPANPVTFALELRVFINSWFGQNRQGGSSGSSGRAGGSPGLLFPLSPGPTYTAPPVNAHFAVQSRGRGLTGYCLGIFCLFIEGLFSPVSLPNTPKTRGLDYYLSVI